MATICDGDLLVCVVTVLRSRSAKWHHHHGIGYGVLVRPHDVLLEPLSKDLHLGYALLALFFGERNSEAPKQESGQYEQHPRHPGRRSPSLPHVWSHICRLPKLLKVVSSKVVEGMICIVIHRPDRALFKLAEGSGKFQKMSSTISRYSSSVFPPASSGGLDAHVSVMLMGVRLTPRNFSTTVMNASVMACCSTSACGKKSRG